MSESGGRKKKGGGRGRGRTAQGGRTFDHASSRTGKKGSVYRTAQKTIVTRNGNVIIVE